LRLLDFRLLKKVWDLAQLGTDLAGRGLASRPA